MTAYVHPLEQSLHQNRSIEDLDELLNLRVVAEESKTDKIIQNALKANTIVSTSVSG